MKVMRGVLLGLLLSACTGGETPSPELTNQERGQIQAEILEWSDQFLAYVNELDAGGVASLFDADAAHFVNGGVYRPSWQAFLNSTQELYNQWTEWNGEWASRRVDVLDFDSALLVGETSGSVIAEDGTTYEAETVFSFVVRRGDDGSWSGLFGHVSGEWTPVE